MHHEEEASNQSKGKAVQDSPDFQSRSLTQSGVSSAYFKRSEVLLAVGAGVAEEYSETPANLELPAAIAVGQTG